jgi:hypothetical protein
MTHQTACILALLCTAGCAWGQDASRAAPAPVTQPAPQPKRIFWIIPNHRTYPTTQNYHPLTTREKFTLARRDSLDPGTFVLAGFLAGIDQANNTNPSFGQGAEGYGHRFVTSYADFAIGDYMTTAVLPSLLHQDPRYFRLGQGSGIHRLGHAVGQIFWTRMDKGGHMFNFSEILGNGAAVAISNAYYPDGRTASDNLGRFGVQIGLDMAGNVLKEFWPDIYDKLGHKKTPASGAARTSP